MRIIRNKKAFLLHQILGYVKELQGDYGIEPIFPHIVSLKRELLRKVENELDFFSLVKFVIFYSSAINSCQYSGVILKEQ